MSTYHTQGGSERKLLLTLDVDPQADADKAERLSRQLFLDIRQLDVAAVDPQIAKIPPKGAKGAPFDWSALLITFGAAGGVFTAIIALARDWLIRQDSNHRISLTIDSDTIVLDRASAVEREELVKAWIRRHAGE